MTTILNDAFGEGGTKVVLAVVLISFLSCTLSLQAAASRLIYSYARDDMIMGSSVLRSFNPTRARAAVRAGGRRRHPGRHRLRSMLSTDALTKIISFATLGIYLGFQMVVLAALRARLKGWVPSGEFTLGGWGMPVNVLALAYGIFAMINMAWPRTPDAPWYDNYIVVLGHRRRGADRADLPVRGQAAPAQRPPPTATPSRRRALQPVSPSSGTAPATAHPSHSHQEDRMKFSYVMLPDYPLDESLASIDLADELGFHAVYAADETWHKDLWLLFAAASRRTQNIRFGPSLSAVDPARADADRPGRRDPGRAVRWPRRGSCSAAATSACSPSTRSTGPTPSRCRGSRRPCT